MPEIKSLKKLNNHNNVIKIFELIRKDGNVYIVQEFCERNLFKEMDDRFKQNKPFTEQEIKIIMGQAISAISYTHKNGLMHRDIKPENFLVKENNSSGESSSEQNWTQWTLKLIDFGTCKSNNESGKQTEYVGTRWYRAPELLLKSNKYDEKIDIFSLGCLMAELFL